MFFRLIRLTSPNLNYIIVAGALCFYASVYFVLWPPKVPNDTVIVFCNVSIVCFVLHVYVQTGFISLSFIFFRFPFGWMSLHLLSVLEPSMLKCGGFTSYVQNPNHP